MTPAAGRGARLLAAGLLFLGTAGACAHDDAQEPAANAGTAAGTPGEAPAESRAPDRLEQALAPSEEEEAELPVSAGRSAPNPGKVERLQQRSRVSRYEAVTGVRGTEGAEGEDAAENELIRIDADSYGTPGMVLVRAMGGAQQMGYTVLELDERDYYFIALKNPSFLSGIVGTGRGVCKIAVGTEPSEDGQTTKVALKARAGTSTSRPVCRKDLEKILKYARGELSDRPKKRERPPWMRNVEP